MKTYISETKSAADMSYSCEDSMHSWAHYGNDLIIYKDEEVEIFRDDSPDEWNGRHGFIIESVFEQMSLHFTGSGIAWGEYQDKKKGVFNILLIPDGLDMPGRSLFDAVESSNEWVSFEHLWIEKFFSELEINQNPTLPYTVGY